MQFLCIFVVLKFNVFQFFNPIIMKQFFLIFIVLLSISAKATNDTCVKAFIKSSSPIIDSTNSIVTCSGSVVNFKGSAIFFKPESNINNANFTWDFGDGTILTDDSTVSHLFDKFGIYVVKLTVTDLTNNCSSSNNAYVKVKVSNIPKISFVKNFEKDSICATSEVNIKAIIESQPWTNFTNSKNDTILINNDVNAITSSLNIGFFNDSQTVTTDTTIKIYAYLEHSKLKDLEIKVICPNGGVSTLKEYKSDYNKNTTLGEPIMIEGNNAKGLPYYYCWGTPSNYSMNKATPSKHKYIDLLGGINTNVLYLPSGQYKPEKEILSFSDLYGCPLNGEWKLQISDKANLNNGYLFGWGIDFQKNLLPDSLYLNPLYNSFNWKSVKLPNAVTDDSLVFTTTESDTGLVTVNFTIKNTHNCTFDSTFSFYVKPVPKIEILTPDDSVFCVNNSIRLIANENPHWAYLWEKPKEEINRDTIKTNILIATLSKAFDGIEYQVYVYDSISQCKSSKIAKISSKICDIIIPTVFTPNGDGINDLFYIKIGDKDKKTDNEIIKLHEKYPGSTLLIFNRNGKKVYEKTDYQSDWDGGNNGDGVYFYILKLNDGSSLNGVINIIGKE